MCESGSGEESRSEEMHAIGWSLFPPIERNPAGVMNLRLSSLGTNKVVPRLKGRDQMHKRLSSPTLG